MQKTIDIDMTMKKYVFFFAAAMTMVVGANAQNGYEDTKHEVAVSYGFVSNSQWIDVYEDIIGAVFGGDYKNEKFVGTIAAEYFYRLKPWLGVGGVFVYGHKSRDMYNRDKKDGVEKNGYFTLMPAVKFDWLRKKNWGLYSKLAIGATLRTETIEYVDPDDKDVNESKVHVNWQASLLGVEAGSPVCRGFLELGCGEQGILVAGLRYKF